MSTTKETWIGKKGFRYWYYHFRDSEYYSLTLIGITLLFSFILLFSYIIPQISEWFSIRDEILATRTRIGVLQNNIRFLTNLDQNKLNNDVNTVTSALPTEKDFSAALTTVSNASIVSGVSLNDFTFQVGSLGKGKNAQTTQKSELNSISVTVVVSGSQNALRRFITTLESSLPISSINVIDGNDQTTAVTILFYQKDFPNIVVSDQAELSTLPAEKLAILQKLQSIKKPIPMDFGSLNASGGGLPLF